MFSSTHKDTNDKEKVSYILLWLGEKGLDIFNSWTFTKEEDKKSLSIFSNGSIGAEDESSNSQIHTTRNATRRMRARLDDFISRLKNLAAKCQFRNNAKVKDRVLDKLTWGSTNADIQKSLKS